MDAATAAAMSNPERNPLFRRRWQETSPEPVLLWPKQGELEELSGRTLLEQCRQERAQGGAVAP